MDESNRGGSRSRLAQLGERLEQQGALPEDVQNGLAGQSAQLAELQERLDFAERLLTEERDRAALRSGDQEA